MSGQSDQQPNNDVMSGTHNIIGPLNFWYMLLLLFFVYAMQKWNWLMLFDRDPS